jgi:hypothetical protein
MPDPLKPASALVVESQVVTVKATESLGGARLTRAVFSRKLLPLSSPSTVFLLVVDFDRVSRRRRRLVYETNRHAAGLARRSSSNA